MENRFVIIVPFYNVQRFIGTCIKSLLSQQYSNYRIVFVNDYSDDGSEDLIPVRPHVDILSKRSRQYALKNIHDALLYSDADDEDIIVLVDGDDYLLHRHVFSSINYMYQYQKCLLTYGQYCTVEGHRGLCRGYTSEEFSRMRAIEWRASHVKTFKFKLYRELLRQDPQLTSFKEETGEFYSMASDVALMYPLMEIAGFKQVYFNPEVLYCYRVHSLNDMSVNRKEQQRMEEAIKQKPSFLCMFQ